MRFAFSPAKEPGQRPMSSQLTPLANLHLTLLEKVGVHQESFADSRGTVSELLEPATL